MSNTLDVNRAVAYTYLARAAMLPLAVYVAALVAVLVGIGYAAQSLSAWWLLFLIPLSGLLLVSVVAIGAGFALLNALKPRKLSKPERQAINDFIDFANNQLENINGLRGGPLGVIFGVLRRKYRGGLSLSEAVVEPLRNTPELKQRYQQLVKTFDRAVVENAADQ